MNYLALAGRHGRTSVAVTLQALIEEMGKACSIRLIGHERQQRCGTLSVRVEQHVMRLGIYAVAGELKVWCCA